MGWDGWVGGVVGWCIAMVFMDLPLLENVQVSATELWVYKNTILGTMTWHIEWKAPLVWSCMMNRV